MVSALYTYQEIMSMRVLPKGLKRIGNKIYYRTINGNWREMKRGDKVWHRGKGRWSKEDLKLDAKRHAKGTPNKKRWTKHAHMFDLKGSRI